MSSEPPTVSLPDTTTNAKMADGANPGADKVPGSTSTPVAGDDEGKSGGSTAETESNNSGEPPVIAKSEEVGNAFVLSEGASFTYGVLGNSAMSKAKLVVVQEGMDPQELGTQTLENKSIEPGKLDLRPRAEGSLSSKYAVGEGGEYDLTVTKHEMDINFTISTFP